MTESGRALRRVPLPVKPFSAELFSPFGEVIEPSPDGAPLPTEAQLDLSGGTPRLYIMTLDNRGTSFRDITRHRRVTQCLGAMGGASWFLAVARPVNPDDPDLQPRPEEIEAFRIPGTVAVKLHRGTWHAGPFFEADTVDFFNLELTDTNISDHDTCRLDHEYGTEFFFDT